MKQDSCKYICAECGSFVSIVVHTDWLLKCLTKFNSEWSGWSIGKSIKLPITKNSYRNLLFLSCQDPLLKVPIYRLQKIIDKLHCLQRVNLRTVNQSQYFDTAKAITLCIPFAFTFKSLFFVMYLERRELIRF